MATRSYRVRLDQRGKEVRRELPDDHDEAREQALAIASRNSAWHGSRWVAKDGDEFAIDESGALAELTTDME